MKTDGEKVNTKPESGGLDSRASSRRDALKKVALYSAYAAPVLLALTRPARAIATSIDF